MINEPGKPIVLYDGVCGLCDRFVQFVIRHDREGVVRFAPLQSGVAKELLRGAGLSQEGLSFIVVIEGKNSFIKSAAVLEIFRFLPGLWRTLAMLRYIPAAISDVVYDLTARNRYALFGKYDACVIPSESQKMRFLS
ncbi:MAG TPA: thiol-disulfide oxidoreductase DCC family protein [Bacteroidota bacterium]|nr:thiol-disulfide oxidoreductase DCC family protein [Bacteroidota bacterium]